MLKLDIIAKKNVLNSETQIEQDILFFFSKFVKNDAYVDANAFENNIRKIIDVL